MRRRKTPAAAVDPPPGPECDPNAPPGVKAPALRDFRTGWTERVRGEEKGIRAGSEKEIKSHPRLA